VTLSGSSSGPASNLIASRTHCGLTTISRALLDQSTGRLCCVLALMDEENCNFCHSSPDRTIHLLLLLSKSPLPKKLWRTYAMTRSAEFGAAGLSIVRGRVMRKELFNTTARTLSTDWLASPSLSDC
jgi:hypothetical protein